MTGHEWRDVLFGVAIGLLLIWLLLIEALAIPKSKVLQLEAAYRRFSSRGAVRRWEEKLRLQLLLVAVLIILILFFLALLLSRGLGGRPVDSTATRSVTGTVIERWSVTSLRAWDYADFENDARQPRQHRLRFRGRADNSVEEPA
jgi:hypothetical protein